MFNSLICALSDLQAFAEQHREQWLTSEKGADAEDLDTQIELYCRKLDISAPSKRNPAKGAGISHLAFTQLPFWWESRPRVIDLDDPSPPPSDKAPRGRMFEPDDEWRSSMRRLRTQAEELRKLTPDSSKKGMPMANPPQFDTTPTCARLNPELIQRAKAAVPETLNLMDNDPTELRPRPPDKVVNARKLVERHEMEGHRRDAAEWAIDDLIKEGVLTARMAWKAPLPFIPDRQSPLPQAQRYKATDFSGPVPFEKFVVQSTDALWNRQSESKATSSERGQKPKGTPEDNSEMRHPVLSAIDNLVEFVRHRYWTLDADERKTVHTLDFQLGRESKRLGLEIPVFHSTYPDPKMQFLPNSRMPFLVLLHSSGDHERVKAKCPAGASPGTTHMLLCVTIDWIHFTQGLKDTAEFLISEKEKPLEQPAVDRKQEEKGTSTLGALIAILEQREKTVSPTDQREAVRDGWDASVIAHLDKKPPLPCEPDVDRIELRCNQEFDGTGLTASNVRSLRAMVFSKGLCSQEAANQLTLAQVADLLDKGTKQVLDGTADKPEHWLTVTKAARVAEVDRGTISRAVSAGQLKSNGERGRARRIDAIDLTRWKLKRAEQGGPGESDAHVEKLAKQNVKEYKPASATKK